MMENNQAKYDRIKEGVQSTWHVSDEEYARTRGEIEEIIPLVVQKSGEAEETVRSKLQEIFLRPAHLSATDKPVGVVNSEEPDGQEWNAREDQQQI